MVFTIQGRGSHLGHVTQTLRTNFCFPTLWRHLVSIGPVVSEEILFENVDADGRRTTTDPISSPRAFGSGELKSNGSVGTRADSFLCMALFLSCLLKYVRSIMVNMTSINYRVNEQSQSII